eukprot:TRINITY_DN20251_c0_g1_i3.p1 TRINITY_DN20251_c0_g1~~TRINITY_DN20251_c0_g1_i3.p1  ORF type:complete len:269 (-),score=55.26 TRINITY_DN20251_c0_g1_i3:88-894(-)
MYMFRLVLSLLPCVALSVRNADELSSGVEQNAETKKCGVDDEFLVSKQKYRYAQVGTNVFKSGSFSKSTKEYLWCCYGELRYLRNKKAQEECPLMKKENWITLKELMQSDRTAGAASASDIEGIEWDIAHLPGEGYTVSGASSASRSHGASSSYDRAGSSNHGERHRGGGSGTRGFNDYLRYTGQTHSNSVRLPSLMRNDAHSVMSRNNAAKAGLLSSDKKGNTYLNRGLYNNLQGMGGDAALSSVLRGKYTPEEIQKAYDEGRIKQY